jgi:hypothetical protein
MDTSTHTPRANQSIYALRSRTGVSVAALGAVLFVTTLAAAAYTNTLMIDAASVIVFFLGLSVSDGSRKAAWWALGFMTCYCLLVAGLLVGLALGFRGIQFGGRPIDPAVVPAAIAVSSTFGVWCSVNLGLLIILLRCRPKVSAPTCLHFFAEESSNTSEPDGVQTRRPL